MLSGVRKTFIFALFEASSAPATLQRNRGHCEFFLIQLLIALLWLCSV